MKYADGPTLFAVEQSLIDANACIESIPTILAGSKIKGEASWACGLVCGRVEILRSDILELLGDVRNLPRVNDDGTPEVPPTPHATTVSEEFRNGS